MREVKVPNYKSDALLQQVLALYNSFKNIKKGEKVNFNLEDMSWAYPLIVLPLTSYIYSTGSTFTIGNSSLKSYLETINFPHGVDSVTAFEQQLHKGKNFVPISILKKDAREQRERLETLFLEMIYKILGNTKGTENAIYYPVAEFISNIFDHSKKDEGFVFGQLYQSKNFLDMCIVDNGRGLANAYKEENKVELSDVDAIKQALEGYSTKRDKERGYGIRTSTRVVCEALGGGFVLLSGNAAFLSFDNKKSIVNLPGFYWQGVIIAYRIPKPTHSINIIPYIE
ncbi:MAG: hypothetical protein NTY34_03565 [Candidatus Omnitrophica bacterium]|nr:hypothetical protein [Candidatus Omnitrophota bacterium]